jgi:hypothetical protein
MIASTWQPNGIETSARVPYNASNASICASAQVSDDGKTVVVRITNMGMVPAKVELTIAGFTGLADDADDGDAGFATPPETWTLQSIGSDGTVNQNTVEVEVGAGRLAATL